MMFAIILLDTNLDGNEERNVRAIDITFSTLLTLQVRERPNVVNFQRYVQVAGPEVSPFCSLIYQTKKSTLLIHWKYRAPPLNQTISNELPNKQPKGKYPASCRPQMRDQLAVFLNRSFLVFKLFIQQVVASFGLTHVIFKGRRPNSTVHSK